jgi:integrase
MLIEAPSLRQAISRAGIPKSSFFYWQKTGQANYQKIQQDGTVYFALSLPDGIQIKDKIKSKPILEKQQVDPIKHKPVNHKAHIRGLFKWRSSGIGVRGWAKSYQEKQKDYLDKYFEQHRSVTSDNLRAWIEETPSTQLSVRRFKHTSVSGLARYLYEILDILSFDEYTKIRMLYPRKPPGFRRNVRIVYEEDVQTILNLAQEPDKNLLLFLSETGLRISEAFKLQISDVRFSSNPMEALIFVREDVGKGGKSRVVPFSKAAQEAVLPLCKRKSSGKVFPYQTLNRILKRIKRLSDKSGIPFSAHSLRHYRISKWANNPRIPITSTQKWAGHSHLAITEGYIHIRDHEALKAAFE